ncbi:hypothetical protein CS063_12730 [Sporanaerobium hydrogeniformans]|uniref:Uncharacterized protein n=1 Tax=Sporanaerobium hydrogeniformans TaxID=3072179 RepID=A0AC61D9V3_9FIRM|nr:alanyl-tRNA editing protein [Sporanaerobium hydrogeniformans]PHV70005.1 hypothetical protein CS063_12730 [Sporanaerobium hydrogeniformans]
MTKKLFYEDGYLTLFEAQVIACETHSEGYSVVLDKTAFYPEGGGQPSDTGTLGEARVNYVFVKEGIIYHIVDKALEVGTKIKGNIDFNRRFDYMQQHTGEHIISGLVNQLYGYNNVGFHLSEEYMTADFDGELAKEQISEIERRANEGIYKNIKVLTQFYQKEDIEQLSYRSKIELPGEVRLVTIEGYDNCACCGIHVAYTGEVGMIKIISAERHRGGMRFTILCGKRALKGYTKKQEIIAELMGLLSTKEDLLPTYIKKLQEELGATKQKLASYRQQALEMKAKEVAKVKSGPICLLEEELVGEEVRKMCLALCEETDEVCLVLSGEGEMLRYALGAKGKDVRSLCRELNKEFSGKGGGQQELCQGSLVGTFETIKDFIEGRLLRCMDEKREGI